MTYRLYRYRHSSHVTIYGQEARYVRAIDDGAKFIRVWLPQSSRESYAHLDRVQFLTKFEVVP